MTPEERRVKKIRDCLKVNDCIDDAQLLRATDGTWLQLSSTIAVYIEISAEWIAKQITKLMGDK